MAFRITLYMLFVVALCIAKTKENHPDQLSEMSFDELYKQAKMYKQQNDSLKARVYFGAFKQKAIREKNDQRLVNGYRSMAIWEENLTQKLAYADSAIYIAKKTNNDEFIGNALYTKGVVYYKHNNWEETLHYYLLADDYISKTTNDYLKYKIKYSIATTQYTLGYYDEALLMAEQCIGYFQKHQDRNHRLGYLNSLHFKALCLNRLENYQASSKVNQFGLQKAKEFDLDDVNYSFTCLEGMNQYGLANYQQALELLEFTLPFFESSNNTKQQSVINFYIGKSYLALNQNNHAISRFKKVDSIFVQTGYLRDDMTESYLFLIANAQQQGDIQKELNYTNRLLEADQLLHNQYKNIAVAIHKEYDTKKLLESKANLEQLLVQNKAKNTWLSIALMAALIGMSLLTIRYVYYRKKFKKLYKQFINQLPKTVPNSAELHILEATPEVVQQEIKEDVVEKILKGLQRFEAAKGFAKHNLTLSKLADTLKTNPKYLSRIIAEHKNKEYSQYINDLRIDYLMKLLETKKYREYTIEALAKEIGYNSSKGFNAVFYKTTGMKFSNFLKEFRKDYKERPFSLSKVENQRAIA